MPMFLVTCAEREKEREREEKEKTNTCKSVTTAVFFADLMFFLCANARICTLLTTDRDLESVIPDKNRKSLTTENILRT